MNRAIAEMTQFLQVRNAGPLLTPCANQLGHNALRVAIVKLLNWLQARHKTSPGHSLELPRGTAWAANLRTLVISLEPLDQLFTINENELHFSPEVSEAERDEVLSFVPQAYRPRLME